MSLFDSVDIENYAEVLLWALNESRREPLKKRDVVVIRYDMPGLALVEAVYSKLIDAHLMPVPMALPTPYMEMERYLNASYGQLLFQAPGLAELYSQAAGVITILSPEDLTHLQTVDPRTIAEARKADSVTCSILEKRKRAGTLGWTTCVYPSEALAEASGMTLEEYTHALQRACWLNMPAPVREWKRIKREVGEVCDWLDSMDIKSLRVESEDINLKVPVGENRRFVGVSGTNIPGMKSISHPIRAAWKAHTMRISRHFGTVISSWGHRLIFPMALRPVWKQDADRSSCRTRCIQTLVHAVWASFP